MTDFTSLGLHPELVQAVTELGFTEPTPIQSQAIPLLLAGQDVIGQAQTGTGKTAAFALPILHALQPQSNQVQGLIVTPTRELAIQVASAIFEYGRIRDARVLAVYGGQPYARQISRLRRGVEVVVGTPGRLLDLIRQKALDLSQVRTVVLDEADEMLSMGFIEDIEMILKETPAERQTALFSATMPPPIRRLADEYMRDPQSVTLEHKQRTVEAIEQRYYLVNPADKLAAISRLFEVEPITSALVFARTRQGSGDLANELANRGFSAEVLNGDLAQEARERVLNRFRSSQVQVLVATDVAARGLDIDDISHVINFDLPEDPEVYVHRVGRTARAGKTGVAITLVTPPEMFRLRRIEGFTRQKMAKCALPTEEEIIAHREGLLLNQVTIWLKRQRYNKERELVGRLVEQGYEPLEIAAAALKIARQDEKQRPIAPVSEVQERPSRGERPSRSERYAYERGGDSPRRPYGRAEKISHEAGMVRLSLSKGRTHGVRPNDVVSTIATHANIPGSAIGKIHIHDRNTYVDVPEKLLAQVLAKAGDYRIHRQPVTVELA